MTWLDALSDPQILIALTLALACLLAALGKPRRLLGIAAVFAVLVAITPPGITDPSGYLPLWGPLESIRSNNRYFAVAGGFALLAAVRGAFRIHISLPPSAYILLTLHGLILVKNLIGGVDQLFSILLFAAFLVVVLIFWTLISSVQTVPQLLQQYETLILYTGFIFLVTNIVQYGLGRPATLIVGGRFSGITSNPQMFTLSIAPFFPLAYHLFRTTKVWYMRAICTLAVLISLYWCFLTGSRLSLVLLVLGYGGYYQMAIPQLALLSVIGLGVFWGIDSLTDDVTAENARRAISTVDTRTEVWKSQLGIFFENPLWGQDFQGGRVTFGESSWLGAAASLGGLGLTFVLILGFRTVKLVVGARRFLRRAGAADENSMIMAIVAVALCGAFFEAYLFGVLTLPMIVFLNTVFMLERLAVLKRRQTSVSQPPRKSFPALDPFGNPISFAGMHENG